MLCGLELVMNTLKVLMRMLFAFPDNSNWIGVQTGVHGFDSCTPHKPVVSKTSEADIWM